MPLINIEFDETKVSANDADLLSRAIQTIVSEETGISDVFVYGDAARIKIQVAPVEIFVRMSTKKIDDIDVLMIRIRARLVEWKQKTHFNQSINLTIIPMNWKIEIGI